MMANVGHSNPKPGLLGLKHLDINKGNLTRTDRRWIDKEIKAQQRLLLKDIYSDQFYNAVRNLIGLQHYRRGEQQEAITLWEETLESDPTNLNALQDLTDAHSDRKEQSESSSYQETLRLLTEQPTNETDITFGRCRVEQAYALFYDINAKSQTDLCNKQVESFETALTMFGHQLSRKEKRDLLLHTAKAHERLCHKYFWQREQEKYLQSVLDVVTHLKECLNLCEEGEKYPYQIWLAMGTTFSRTKDNEHILQLPEDFPHEYRHMWNDPSQCFQEALGFNTETEWISGFLGIHYLKTGKWEQAEEHLTSAIDGLRRENVPCGFFYLNRAKLNIKMAKKISESQRKMEYLNKSKKDIKDARHQLYTADVLTTEGEVYHLLSQEQPEEKEALIKKALKCFEGAVRLNDDKSFHHAHLKCARCLIDKEKYRSAIESYKVVFESTKVKKCLQLKPRCDQSVASELLRAMLQSLRKNKNTAGLKEVEFWMGYIHMYFRKNWPDWCPSDRLKSEMDDIVKEANQMAQDSPSLRLHINNFQIKTNEILGKEAPTNMQYTQPTPDSPSYYHQPPETCLADGYEYDFYVVNDENDYDADSWVQHILLTGLEDLLQGLKGYYHRRDAMDGCLDLTARKEAVSKSAHHLVIVNSTLHANAEFLGEVADMFSGKQVVVVLILGQTEVPANLGVEVCHKFDMAMGADILGLARYLAPEKPQEEDEEDD